MNFGLTLTCRLSREANERNFVLDKPQAVFVGFGRGYPFVFADAHVSLADKREDAWLRHDLRFESGCWRNTAECGGVVFENVFPYNPMIFDSEKTTEKIRQTVRIRLLAAV